MTYRSFQFEPRQEDFHGEARLAGEGGNDRLLNDGTVVVRFKNLRRTGVRVRVVSTLEPGVLFNPGQTSEWVTEFGVPRRSPRRRPDWEPRSHFVTHVVKCPPQNAHGVEATVEVSPRLPGERFGEFTGAVYTSVTCAS